MGFVLLALIGVGLLIWHQRRSGPNARGADRTRHDVKDQRIRDHASGPGSARREPAELPPCRWKRDPRRPRDSKGLERWYCQSCRAEAFSSDGPPRTCRRHEPAADRRL